MFINKVEVENPNSSTTTEFTFIDEDVVDSETYVYDLYAVTLNGTSFAIGSTTLTIDIPEPPELPQATILHYNFPNPFM